MARRPEQLELLTPTWGGRREGAGRKRGPGRHAVPHRTRPLHDRHCPAHVTLRACSGLPSLRHGALPAAVRKALVAASTHGFRVLQFSIQSDHLHLLVEADEPTGFMSGVRGLAIRVAKAFNRALGRHGRVWSDRYHSHLLKTPREVRNALVYVLNNVRKHLRNVRGLDPCSSAGWFDGWKSALEPIAPQSPVPTARTWLLRKGWRRHGLIDVDEGPQSDR